MVDLKKHKGKKFYMKSRSKGKRVLSKAAGRGSKKGGGGFMGNYLAPLTINKGLGLPLVFRTKHRYDETVTLTSTAGSYATYVFSCNGMFDPNVTGTGHQPMYFDQLNAIYNHYRVLGSKIRVEFLSVSTTTVAPCYCEVYVDDDVAVATSTSQAIELGMLRKQVTVGGINNKNTSNIAYNKFSLKEIFRDKYESADVSGSGAANPVEQTYYVLGVQAVDGSSTVAITCHVTIDYVADWYELTTTPQS